MKRVSIGMEKKKILQVNKSYYPTIGGIEKTVQQIAEGLSEQTEMSVLVCSENRRLVEETINGVKITRVPSIFKWGNLPIPLGFNSALRQLSKAQDVIHLHMPFPFGDLACLLSGYKGKIVLWWHSDVVRQKKMMLLYKPIMLGMLKRADAIVVATEGHINGSAYLEPFREKCVIIPFGVNKNTELVADEYMANREKTIKNNKIRFLFVGRLVYYKGCKVLLESFAQVKDAELVIVGSGVMEEELKQLARKLQINEDVHFMGEVSEEELLRQYAQCDVFVLPSIAKSEAFALVQIEAMAFGKPVINTNLPSGVPYVSLDKITGLTVKPGDVESLSVAMQWLVEHEEERLAMGDAARKRMKEEYRLEKMLERVYNIYVT